MDKKRVYVGVNGEIYDSQADAKKYGSKPSRGYGNRAPVDVDEKGNVRYPVYVGKNGELYNSSAEAKKYGSKPSKRNPDLVPARVTKEGKLEKVAATTSIIGLLGGLFFLSSNITGNVIGNMTNSTSNWIGGVLFLVGIVGALVYFRKK